MTSPMILFIINAHPSDGLSSQDMQSRCPTLSHISLEMMTF